MEPRPVSPAAQIFAWLGGAAFVASLAYFVKFYTFALEVPVPTRTPGLLARNLLIDTLLFTVFAVHHSVLARPEIKRLVTRLVPPALERSVYVWTASVLFFAVCYWWARIPGDALYRLDGGPLWLSHALQIAGFSIIFYAARSLDALDLAGIRQALGRPASRSTGITTAFPYNVVRHPIYLGWILTIFPVGLMTVDRFAFACLSTTYMLVAIPWEERALFGTFGEEYRRYREMVRWRVIPGIY
jgi:methanethiol S-methyltransferase